MPINNNVQALNAYDHADGITVEFLGAVSSPSLQQPVHCLSFEILKGWNAVGLAAYNDETNYEATAQAIVETAKTRVALNPATGSRVGLLTASDIGIARQQGENYFEHTYVYIVGGVDPNAKKILYRDKTDLQ